MRFLAAAYITTISSHIHSIQLGQLDCSTVLKSGLLGLLQFATEAAITILRIDDMIKLFKEENQGGED
jgi:chaperonin GroEL (HSP60 family)